MTAGPLALIQSPPVPPGTTPRPRWVWGVVLLALLAFLSEFVVFTPGGWTDQQRGFCFAAFLAVDATIFLLASFRGDFALRFRLALRLTGLGFCMGVLNYLLQGVGVYTSAQESGSAVISYLLALAGVLTLPLRPVTRLHWRLLLADGFTTLVGIVVTGLVLYLGTVDVTPPVPGAFQSMLAQLLSMSLVLLAVLNLGVRGVPLPSSRALALALFGLGALFLSLVLEALRHGAVLTDIRVFDGVYLLTLMLLLFSGVAYLRDRTVGATEEAGTRWVLSLSPLPVIMLGCAAFLLFWALGRKLDHVALTAAVGLVLMVLPLLYRQRVTHAEALRLAQAEAERERSANQARLGAVGRLSAGLAHELNSLLTVMLGHAELAREAAGDRGEAVEDIALIERAGQRAASLTRRLLVFSGGQFTTREVVALDGLVERTVRELVQEGGAAWPITVPVNTRGLTVAADAGQLTEALRQLVENAREALPDGGPITVTLEAATLDAPLESPFLPVPAGRYAILAVRDGGRGIPPEVLPRIFDPFFSTQPRHAAPGLGLAVVYGVVVAHGGGITVETLPGRGTTVRLYFPTSDGTAPPGSSTPPAQ